MLVKGAQQEHLGTFVSGTRPVRLFYCASDLNHLVNKAFLLQTQFLLNGNHNHAAGFYPSYLIITRWWIGSVESFRLD